jgi:hypothetical protein
MGKRKVAKGASRTSRASEAATAHAKRYGKEYHEVKYHDTKCPICGSRIDEFGFCACGAGGS